MENVEKSKLYKLNVLSNEIEKKLKSYKKVLSIHNYLNNCGKLIGNKNNYRISENNDLISSDSQVIKILDDYAYTIDSKNSVHLRIFTDLCFSNGESVRIYGFPYCVYVCSYLASPLSDDVFNRHFLFDEHAFDFLSVDNGYNENIVKRIKDEFDKEEMKLKILNAIEKR